MKFFLLLLCTAFGLAARAAPVSAQTMSMSGMKMATPDKSAQKKNKAKKKSTKPVQSMRSEQAMRVAPAQARIEPSAKPSTMPGMTMPKVREPTQTQMPMAKPGEHGQAGKMPMPMASDAGHQALMTGALGPYSMERESSGTAWQPDSSNHAGLMLMSGEWMLMAHGIVNLVYDHQSGARGDDKAFVSGMLMGMARRPLGNGTVQFKAMLSPDPLMGPRGYPLLLASGETANGRDRLIDRQHPHDLFMELSASLSQDIGPKGSLFVYAGLPGEPAFGPPAFMHRESILDSPEAPITHHWLDSTHISFGVVTAGLVLDDVKLEVSRFNGREPDQHRWNIETGPLDSTAIRLSWNPTRTLALQTSWGHFTDPEQLEPGVDQKRWSASAMWADEIAPGWKVATTLAWGRKSANGHSDDAIAVETSLNHAHWTLFGRGEMTENRELIQGQEDPAYRVGKVSLGSIRDMPVASHLSVGVGGLLSLDFVPRALAPLYGGQDQIGVMGFVRFKID